MRIRWTSLLPALCLLAGPVSLFAEEPVFEFVEGLRNRGYFDTVDDYLDQVQNDPRISPKVKERIPYERALTLRRSIESIKSAKAQHKQLDLAAAHLAKFLKASPKHPLAANAKTVRGDIFLGKTEVNINQLQGPGSADQKAEIRKQALANIGKAKAEFNSAIPQFKAQLDAFETYIPPDQKERRRQRKLAENRYITAQLSLAKCTYTEAHIYDRKDLQFRTLLTEAFKQFASIHTRYRSLGYGLYARMWQGKCFEEQGEIGRALGIYGELLDHPSKSPLMQMVQRDALYFKLICLNHESEKRYQIVENEATAWWKRNARYRTSRTGLGLKLELARARKMLGTVSEDLTRKEKESRLRLAQQDAEYVARYPGRHRIAAAMLVEQIKRLRGEDSQDPTNFADAVTRAMVVYANIKPQLNAYRNAKNAGKPPAEVQRLQTLLKSEVDETARLLRLAQSLYKPGDDVNQLNKARYFSAYTAFLQAQYLGMEDRVYDGAVYADFVSRHAKTDNPDRAMDAAYLAMVLYIRAYNQAPPGRRDAEIRWIIDTGKYLYKNWPNAKTAAEASMNIGKLYDKRNEPLLAARWFTRVPASAKTDYPHAQVRAGHAYWSQFIATAAIKPEPANILAVQRKKTESDLVAGVANLANPSWRARLELERERAERAEALQSAGAKKNKPAAKKGPAAAGKTPQPASPELAALDRQIAALKSKSVAELKTALGKMPSVAPGSFDTFPEQELRKTLIDALNKLTRADLRQRHEAALAALSPEQLKAHFSADLEEWKEAAARHLKNGISRLTAQMPARDPSIDDLTNLITAKVSLASYQRTRGNYKEVIGLLTGKPHSVIDAISVKDEKKRPNTGIKGRPFAGEVYQLLLRAYVGTQNIDAALKTMESLESAISAEDAEKITDIYENLGRELQKEIERLRNRDDQDRLAEVRDSFKRFLGELFKRKDALKYSTLIWIAETYFSLGEGLGDDPEAAGYYEKAFGAYSRILDEPDLDEPRRRTVKLRQIRCKRHQQEYAEAVDIAKDVLSKNAMLLSAQFEAAYALQHWGTSGEYAKHLEAINGIKQSNIWGWSGAAGKLNGLLNRTDLSAAERATYNQKFLEARYNMAWNRLQYALSLSSDKTDKKRDAVLRNALAEIDDFATGYLIGNKQFKDDESGTQVDARKRFDEIYKTIQEEMGRSGNQIVTIDWPKPLPPEPAPVVAAKKAEPTGGSESAVAATQPKDEKTKPAEAGTNWLGIIGGVIFLAIMLAGGGWFLLNMSKQQKNRRNLYAGIGTSTFTPPPAAPANRSAANPQPRAGNVNPAARKKSQQRTAGGGQRPAGGGGKKPTKRPPKPTS